MQDETSDADHEHDARSALDDGRNKAFIVWADEQDDEQPARVRLDLTIATGARRGDVVSITGARFTRRDPLDLVGLPCTLVVERGVPRMEV